MPQLNSLKRLDMISRQKIRFFLNLWEAIGILHHDNLLSKQRKDALWRFDLIARIKFSLNDDTLCWNQQSKLAGESGSLCCTPDSVLGFLIFQTCINQISVKWTIIDSFLFADDTTNTAINHGQTEFHNDFI